MWQMEYCAYYADRMYVLSHQSHFDTLKLNVLAVHTLTVVYCAEYFCLQQ